MEEVVVVREHPGGPSSLFGRPGQRPAAPYAVWWTDGGDSLAVALPGSASHPTKPVGWTLHPDQALELEIGRPTSGVRSLDASVLTTVVQRPHGLDPTRAASVRIGEQVVPLPPAGSSTNTDAP
jgi:hypothetical protein